MELLFYNELQTRRHQDQFDRVCHMLRQGNFRQAEVKKLAPSHYYRAKLNDTDRLLFTFVRHQGQCVILILEIIYNHEYEKSRFLQGATVDEKKIPDIPIPEAVVDSDVAPWLYRNPAKQTFHLLDRPLSFDEFQEHLFHLRLPLIIVGSAGSGKTVLSLEKLKTLPGEILYVTRSSYLAENARRLYSSFGYDNPKQNVDFLAFDELIQSLRTPPGRAAEFSDFQNWLREQPGRAGLDAHQLHEEFSGVLTGSRVDKPRLEREEYEALGVKQSIFPVSERDKIYTLFLSWCGYLEKNVLYSETMLCHAYLGLAQPRYDYLVVDEVQDLTNVQLFLLIKCLKTPFHFLLCGDSNQIVHPNFFSWSAVKSLFFRENVAADSAEIKVLHANYRNSRAVTELANQILRLKVARFGSLDRESNFLVDCVSEHSGLVQLVQDDDAARRELNEKTAKSVHFAVLVLRDSEKETARKIFKTPLVFTVREAKGLEYRNIVILNLVSSCRAEFEEIARDVDPAELSGELRYSRNRDKSDKALEIYKFFINSLYVAVTRAVENVYWLERDAHLRPFRLLNLAPGTEKLTLKSTTSSADEWRKEAVKLVAQGKQEQAQRILHDVLKITPVPWEVTSRDQLPALFSNALNPQQFNRQAKQKLLNYAMAYEFQIFPTRLQYCGYPFAGNLHDSARHYSNTFDVPYNQANRKKLLKDLQQYGIDFRDAFNRTPLMRACALGDAALAEMLLQQDANPTLTDNHGYQAFHYLLQRLWRGSIAPFHPLYAALEPDHLIVRIDDHQVKLGRQSMEFFLVNALFACTCTLMQKKKDRWEKDMPVGFNTADLVKLVASLPEFIMPAYRKQRPYISSLLSRHERNNCNPSGKQLFFRMQRGEYILNPSMMFSSHGEWLPWDELLNIHFLQWPDRDIRTAVTSIMARRVRRNMDTDCGEMIHLWLVLRTIDDAANPLSPLLQDECFAHIDDEKALQMAKDVFSLQAELPPLPKTMEELDQLRGKRHESFDPLFLTVEDWQQRYLAKKKDWQALKKKDALNEYGPFRRPRS